MFDERLGFYWFTGLNNNNNNNFNDINSGYFTDCKN